MRYLPIDNSLFVKNRENYAKLLKEGALAIFNANDIAPTNGDGTRPFKQNSDLFYLSGIDQEETILLLFPDCNNEKFREVVFIKKTDEHIRVWEGDKLTKDQAKEVSGIQNIYWLDDFETILDTIIYEAKCIYLNSNEHARASKEVETRDDRFRKWLSGKYPLHQLERSAPIMHQLRPIKSTLEIELIQTACNITEKAFRRVLSFVKPGVMEYEIEAEIAHEFTINRANGHAYAPIVASGKNACVLHYISNNEKCVDGDLLLMDFGAEYANYCSDLTRTIPVNGKYTQRQKEVYNAVLHVMKEAKKMLTPGNTFTEYNKAVGILMEEQLIKLGLLDAKEVKEQNPDQPLYRKYFMHGTSHALGLDTHDVDNRARPFETGMVFTCEPGIYIREENIGVRIENDILITEKGPRDLMEKIPIEADDIEDLMQK